MSDNGHDIVSYSVWEAVELLIKTYCNETRISRINGIILPYTCRQVDFLEQSELGYKSPCLLVGGCPVSSTSHPWRRIEGRRRLKGLCSWNGIWINGPGIRGILMLIVSRPNTDNNKRYDDGKYQYLSEVMHGLVECRDVIYEEKLTPAFCLFIDSPLAKLVPNRVRTIAKENILNQVFRVCVNTILWACEEGETQSEVSLKIKLSRGTQGGFYLN